MREAAAAKAAKAHAKFEKMAAAREAEAAEEHADLEREHAALRAKVEESKRVREAEAKGRVQKVEYMGDRCDDISSLSKLSEETLQDREQACLHDLLAIAQARFVRQWTAREQSLKKIHAGQLRDATTELSALQSQLRFERAGSDQLRSDVSQLRAQLAQGGGGGHHHHFTTTTTTGHCPWALWFKKFGVTARRSWAPIAFVIKKSLIARPSWSACQRSHHKQQSRR